MSEKNELTPCKINDIIIIILQVNYWPTLHTKLFPQASSQEIC